MIDSVLHTGDLLVAGIWSLVCFGFGVSYSAYRAVGWADRMRAWANTCELPDTTTERTD